MSETTNPQDTPSGNDEANLSFADLFEQSEVGTKKEGEVVRGRIIAIRNDNAIVDIGFKSEGSVDLHEFRNSDGVDPKVGDEFDVLLVEAEDDSGKIVLSKEKADKMKVWDEISQAFDDDGIVEGRIIARVKGGLNVDIGVRAFLPGSQVDLRPVRNLEKLVGTISSFKILKFNRRRGNIVLSRRALLEKEREELRVNTLERLAEGAILEGIVKNITDYGAFIDLGGIDGLLHITDMSWGRVNHPSEVFVIGDEVKTVVLKYDPERQRVSLGLKQITPDPWKDVDKKYKIAERIEGKVVSLTDYGAFIELEQGVEGLIHVSEMSWTKKIKHPSKLLAVGDIVESIILDINVDNRRISLGLKQTEPNPWDIIEEHYPVGTHIVGKIRNITDFGLFVGIDEGIDGLIHISDISWSQRIKHPGEIFKKSQEVEAIVLSIDRANERFSLGIKQLSEDPWASVVSRYNIGDIITGEIISIADFGVFVSIEEGVEGLVHISELSMKKIDNPADIVKVNEKITAEIMNIDSKDRKIRLSRRVIEGNAEKSEYASYVAKHGSARSQMADLIAAATSNDKGEEATEAAPDSPAPETAPDAEMAPEAPEAEVIEELSASEASPISEGEDKVAVGSEETTTDAPEEKKTEDLGDDSEDSDTNE